MSRHPSTVASESPSIRLVDKTRALRDGSDSEHDSEANFRHGARKRHETGTPINIGVNLGVNFFR